MPPAAALDPLPGTLTTMTPSSLRSEPRSRGPSLRPAPPPRPHVRALSHHCLPVQPPFGSADTSGLSHPSTFTLNAPSADRTLSLCPKGALSQGPSLATACEGALPSGWRHLSSGCPPRLPLTPWPCVCAPLSSPLEGKLRGFVSLVPMSPCPVQRPGPSCSKYFLDEQMRKLSHRQ